MKKLRHRKRSAKHSVSYAKGSLALWYSRSHVITVAALVFLIIAVAGTSYGVYNHLASQGGSTAETTANQDEKSLEDNLSSI